MPFVAATGAAALIHSTWALGTLFAGEQPESIPHLIGWLIPALLIAFALDVGQIVTASDIRHKGLTITRGITFIVFAAATYYLQWLYIAHHMPMLELSDGVRATWADTALVLRDAAVWIIPALLPLSTLLYTFSGSEDVLRDEQPRPQVDHISIEAPETPVLPENAMKSDAVLADALQNETEIKLEEGVYTVECSSCGWKKEYDNLDSAQKGLRVHKSRHCSVLGAKRLNGHHEQPVVES